MQRGFVVGATSTVMVKLVAAVRAETYGVPSTSDDCVLQVTESLVPRELSRVSMIWEFAVTAVVLTTSVVPAAGSATEPAEAAEHAAGEAEEEQFVPVE